jgi:hypothetical protein
VKAAPKRIEVDAVDFQVSCRRFTIKATVTRDRQLPVVDEFVLRLLAVLERMPLARMRAWFGFSEAEIETVLVDMGRRKLIVFDHDDIILAPAGRELFRAVGEGGVPHLVEVGPLIGDVWFDLVSRNMVQRSRSRNVDYLVRMTEQPSARELPEAFAREAFEENFRDYAKRIRRLPDPDAINLYSISDVEGGAYGYQVLPAELVLDMDRMSVRPTFPDVGDGARSFQKLAVAANDAWQLASPPDVAPSTAVEFERMTGDGRFAPLIHAPGRVGAWLNAIDAADIQRPHFKPTIGASYLKENLSKLVDEISKLEPQVDANDITWLRPSGSTWGRTLRVAEAIQTLRATLRNAGRLDVGANLAMPRSTHKGVRSNHKRLFDRGYLLPQGHLPANLEVLLVRNVAAYVNVHLPVGGHAVPIGGVVTEPKRLARIADRLKPFQAEGWEEIWHPSQPKRH